MLFQCRPSRGLTCRHTATNTRDPSVCSHLLGVNKSWHEIFEQKKALETIGYYSKLFFKNKYLVTRKGKLLMLENIVVNGSLWSNVVGKKEVISHSSNKRLQGLKHFIMASESPHFVKQGCLFLHCSSYRTVMTDCVQIFSELLRCYAIMLGYTKWEHWSWTITKGVQCFKGNMFIYVTVFSKV